MPGYRCGIWGDDPCILPKARKNAVEMARRARCASGRWRQQLSNFLPGSTDEAPKGGAVGNRRSPANWKSAGAVLTCLQEISFDTISGAGPNGAIVHYRVTEETNRAIETGRALSGRFSGGQYLNGTTDITRTIAVGEHQQIEQRDCYTRVLQGMIAISDHAIFRKRCGRTRFGRACATGCIVACRASTMITAPSHGVGSLICPCMRDRSGCLARLAMCGLNPGMMLSKRAGLLSAKARLVFGLKI